MDAADNPGVTWTRDNVGNGGATADYFAGTIATLLAAEKHNHVAILYNVGRNDFGVGTVEADWKADVLAVADACNARWPDAPFYMMRPWAQGQDARADEFAGWINDLVGLRTFIELGPDERVWLKGADNGATNTYDGVHYSAAGQTACASAWLTLLGY